MENIEENGVDPIMEMLEDSLNQHTPQELEEIISDPQKAIEEKIAEAKENESSTLYSSVMTATLASVAKQVLEKKLQQNN